MRYASFSERLNIGEKHLLHSKLRPKLRRRDILRICRLFLAEVREGRASQMGQMTPPRKICS